MDGPEVRHLKQCPNVQRVEWELKIQGGGVDFMLFYLERVACI